MTTGGKRTTIWVVGVVCLSLFLTTGVAGAQPENTCVDITTGNAEGDNRPSTVLVESTDGDYGKVKETTESSDLDVCPFSENLDHVIHYAAPPGEYLIQVRYDEPPVNERWGNFERTVEDTDEESFWLRRKAPYHTSVSIDSPRGTNRFSPGERGDFEIRIYNGETSGSKEVTTEAYVYPEGDSRPSEPAKTFSPVSVGGERKETVDGSIPIPDSEGTYTVAVELQTDFGFRELTSDYVAVGTISVDSFEPPKITSSTPSRGSLDIGPQEQQRFSVSVSDPDSKPMIQWTVNGDRTTTGTDYEFDADQYGPGEHTVTVTASDETDQTADAQTSWTVDVAEPPEITSVSPGETAVTVGETVRFSADTQSSGLSYQWTINGSKSTGSSVETSFGSTGEKPVQVAVTNDRGITTERSFVVTVDGEPPSLTNYSVGPSTVTAGETVSLSAAATDPSDRDLDFEYEWRIGDQTYQGATAETTLSQVGTHEVLLSVENEFGTTTTRTQTVTVSNHEPEIERLGPDTNETSLTGSDNEFSVRITNADAEPATVQWSVDGEQVESKTVTTEERRVTFSPEITDPGSHTVTATVSDDHGATAAVDWTATVENQPPRIDSVSPVSSSLTETVDTTKTFNVSATDPESGALTHQWLVNGNEDATGRQFSRTFAEPGTQNITVVVTDPDGGTTSQSWMVSVQSFRVDPKVESSTRLTEFEPQASGNFIDLSFRNPTVNEQTAVVELSVAVPNGMSVSGTKNVASGSQSEFVGQGTVTPGDKTSIGIDASVLDESLAGQQVDVPYQVIYYPEGDRENYRIIEDSTQTIQIVGTDSQPDSGENTTEPDESTDTDLTTESAPGFTIESVLIALGVVVSAVRLRSDR